MKRGTGYLLALTTAPSSAVGARLAERLVRERTAACVNLLPGARSWYWWKGKIEQTPEVLLLIKTRRSRLRALSRALKAHHPYELPELVTLPITDGAPAYLKWLESSLKEFP